jgi:hypothetical protein
MSEDIRRKLEKQRQQLIKELEQNEASGPRVEIAAELREPRSDRAVDAATAVELEHKCKASQAKDAKGKRLGK